MNSLAIILLVLCWICTCPVAVDITDVDDYDPGTCDKSNVLQVYSVNDRNNEKKLWICNKENGQYLWKPVDGDAYVGEFLNPGEHCSDILDHELDADDGFYWVTLEANTKRRVWCDMKTDGGGYMLVARKHDAITWDIPSKDKPVEPKSSDKYWTSQLGDALILDFRIQLSTSDSFDDMKAQWSYRLKNKRPLGQLMITDHGCDSNSPGIGDIAFVKDLMTGKIVTTAFQCSVFGLAYSSTLGWAMMNKCLKKPCSGSGHFHYPGGTLELDHTGVFSYSVLDNISGYDNEATSYIGCDRKKCCGCFGPVGGTANYCTSNCNAINGGTIIDPKKIYTWVWMRSSLPKRIWNRCMEYQSQDSKGQLEWYNLVGDSAIPKKGRCPGLGKLRLNSGVVVVPDNVTAMKLPAIPGMLEYRKDEKKLYVRANKTWNLLTQEKEVKGKLIQLEESTDTRLKELKGEINATDTNLQGKIDTRYAELKGAADAENAELKGKIEKINAKYAELKKSLGVLVSYKACTQYKWLNESDRRYDYYDSSNQKCDNNLAKGWYRFGGGAGSQMYTSCRSNYYCNAEYPGYMSDSHPGFGDGIVSRTVCFRFEYYGNCCQWSDTIKALNCGLYYVYELHPQGSCNRRYCSS